MARSSMGILLALLLALLGLGAGYASESRTVPVNALAKLPVKEITVFKDGHAFVLHEGRMPVNADGNVVLDHLPTPVIGTFWPFSADPMGKLQSVAAGRRRIALERTALTLRDLVEANPKTEVLITEAGQSSYPATIIGFLNRTAEELEA